MITDTFIAGLGLSIIGLSLSILMLISHVHGLRLRGLPSIVNVITILCLLGGSSLLIRHGFYIDSMYRQSALSTVEYKYKSSSRSSEVIEHHIRIVQPTSD